MGARRHAVMTYRWPSHMSTVPMSWNDEPTTMAGWAQRDEAFHLSKCCFSSVVTHASVPIRAKTWKLWFRRAVKEPPSTDDGDDISQNSD